MEPVRTRIESKTNHKFVLGRNQTDEERPFLPVIRASIICDVSSPSLMPRSSQISCAVPMLIQIAFRERWFVLMCPYFLQWTLLPLPKEKSFSNFSTKGKLFQNHWPVEVNSCQLDLCGAERCKTTHREHCDSRRLRCPMRQNRWSCGIYIPRTAPIETKTPLRAFSSNWWDRSTMSQSEKSKHYFSTNNTGKSISDCRQFQQNKTCASDDVPWVGNRHHCSNHRIDDVWVQS